MHWSSVNQGDIIVLGVVTSPAEKLIDVHLEDDGAVGHTAVVEDAGKKVHTCSKWVRLCKAEEKFGSTWESDSLDEI